MGAGQLPAGAGPAGWDPPADVDASVATPIVAAFFDPETRTFALADGSLVPVHPVDQEVALRLGVPFGSLRASANIGIKLARLKSATPDAMPRTVSDVVHAMLDDLIAAGDIQLLGTPLMPEAAGRPLYFVDYVNLRLPTSAPSRRIRASM